MENLNDQIDALRTRLAESEAAYLAYFEKAEKRMAELEAKVVSLSAQMATVNTRTAVFR